MIVMGFVHVAKAVHTHAAADTTSTKQECPVIKTHIAHASCHICEFQPAKDAPFTGDIIIQIAPAFFAPTYSRIFTTINPDGLFVIDGRGPPSYTV